MTFKRRLLALAAAVVLIPGCRSEEEPGFDAAPAAVGEGAVEATEPATVEPPVRAVLSLGPSAQATARFELRQDLTGDGVLDTLRVESVGESFDSATIALTILVGQTEAYRVEWRPRYELGPDPVPTDASEAELHRLLAASLERRVHAVDVQPFDGKWISVPWENRSPDCQSDPRNCIATKLLSDAGDVSFVGDRASRFDTLAAQAIAEDMLANTSFQVSFRYGYETGATVAWSQLRNRFFMLLGCC